MAPATCCLAPAATTGVGRTLLAQSKEARRQRGAAAKASCRTSRWLSGESTSRRSGFLAVPRSNLSLAGARKQAWRTATSMVAAERQVRSSDGALRKGMKELRVSVITDPQVDGNAPQAGFKLTIIDRDDPTKLQIVELEKSATRWGRKGKGKQWKSQSRATAAAGNRRTRTVNAGTLTGLLAGSLIASRTFLGRTTTFGSNLELADDTISGPGVATFRITVPQDLNPGVIIVGRPEACAALPNDAVRKSVLEQQGANRQLIVTSLEGDADQGTKASLGLAPNPLSNILSAIVGAVLKVVNDAQVALSKRWFLKSVIIQDLSPTPAAVYSFPVYSWTYRDEPGEIYFESEATLANKSSLTVQQFRRIALEVMREVYKYDVYDDLSSPATLSDTSNPKYRPPLKPYPRRLRGTAATLPLDEDFDYVKRKQFLTVAVLGAVQSVLADPGAAVRQLAFGLPPWTRVDQMINGLYKYGSSIINLFGLFKFPNPLVINNPNCIRWESDFEFARERVAGIHPTTIKKVSELPTDLGGSGQPEVVSSLEQELAAGRLYTVDYTGVADYLKSIDQPNKEPTLRGGKYDPNHDVLYAPRAFFRVDKATGDLLPVAIQLERAGRLYTPSEESAQLGNQNKEWTPARIPNTPLGRVFALWIQASNSAQIWLLSQPQSPLTKLALWAFYFADSIEASRGTDGEVWQRRYYLLGENYAAFGQLQLGEFSLVKDALLQPQERGPFIAFIRMVEKSFPSNMLLFMSDKAAGGTGEREKIKELIWEKFTSREVLERTQDKFPGQLIRELAASVQRDKKNLAKNVENFTIRYMHYVLYGFEDDPEIMELWQGLAQAYAAKRVFPLGLFVNNRTDPVVNGLKSKYENSVLFRDVDYQRYDLTKDRFLDALIPAMGVAAVPGALSFLTFLLTTIPGSFKVPVEDRNLLRLTALESIRLHTPVNPIAYYLSEDLTVKMGKKRVRFPKGTPAGINVWVASQNKAHFDLATASFNPHRENLEGNFLNFNSVGEQHPQGRQCPGRKIVEMLGTDVLHAVHSRDDDGAEKSGADVEKETVVLDSGGDGMPSTGSDQTQKRAFFR